MTSGRSAEGSVASFIGTSKPRACSSSSSRRAKQEPSVMIRSAREMPKLGASSRLTSPESRWSPTRSSGHSEARRRRLR